jgi:hypothetical protein
MKVLLAICLSMFLISCATGSVYVAKNEPESIKAVYDDPILTKLYTDNEGFFRQIFYRFNKANIDFYRQGIGLTLLKDQNGRNLHYLMVSVRPQELYFNEMATTPEQRFSLILQGRFEKYLSYMKREDLDREDIEGLSFGVYWAVRDFSQCDTYGGFVEYITIYFKKDDIQDLLAGNLTFPEAINGAEVFTSLKSEAAKNVRPVF